MVVCHKSWLWRNCFYGPLLEILYLLKCVRLLWSMWLCKLPDLWYWSSLGIRYLVLSTLLQTGGTCNYRILSREPDSIKPAFIIQLVSMFYLMTAKPHFGYFSGSCGRLDIVTESRKQVFKSWQLLWFLHRLWS